MLVLERKITEVVRLFVPPSDKPQTIEVSLEKINGFTGVRLGFVAAKEVRILRGELVDKESL
jgi:sRNA-binding carbon storage regulator CsrA